jgi:hypothetical protein
VAPSRQQSPLRDAPALPTISGPLADLCERYADYDSRSRFGMRVARDERAESYPSSIIGVIKDRRYLILTAPANKQNVLMPIAKEEEWLFRLFNATTVYSFMSRILKVAYSPIPYIHIELPKIVDRRRVRKQPRALASLPIMLHRAQGDPAVIVDISVSGVRLAVPSDTQLEINAVVPLLISISLLDRIIPLTINAKITTHFGASDARYADIHFYGAQFEGLSTTAELVVHGFVQEQLAAELDRQSRALVIEAAYRLSIETWLSNR